MSRRASCSSALKADSAGTPEALAPPQDDSEACEDNQERRCPENGGAGREPRLQQDEFAIAGHDEILDLRHRCRPWSGARGSECARSLASGASDSSIDWFWQTRQRKPADRSRARCFQFRILENFIGLHGVGGRQRARGSKAGTISFRRNSCGREFPLWRADPVAAVGERQGAAKKHDERAEPDQRHQRIEIDPHDPCAIGRSCRPSPHRHRRPAFDAGPLRWSACPWA